MNSDATSGTAQWIGRARGTPTPDVVTFNLTEPLAARHYLNLSQPVNGTFFWTGSATTSSGYRGGDAAHLRLELYIGDEFVGGTDYTFDWTLGVTAGSWVPFPFHFRPEVRYLDEGKVLSLRVIRFSGTADFVIGTGGPQQSWFQFHYYDFDPLASNVYVQQGVLMVGAQPDVNQTAETFGSEVSSFLGTHDLPSQTPNVIFLEGPAAPEGNGPAVLAWAGILVIGLPSLLRGRFRRLPRAWMVAAILLGTFMSGCLSERSGSGPGRGVGSDDDKSRAKVSIMENQNLALEGRGAIRGVVHSDDAAALPIQNARVALLGTYHHQETDRFGKFAFLNLTPATYRLAVDAQGYPAFEASVPVVAGNISQVDVILSKGDAAARAASPAAKMHRHDDWAGRESILLQSVSFVPNGTSERSGGPRIQQDSWTCATAAYSPGALTNTACESPIPINLGKPILPGTVMVEVSLDWNTQASNSPKELGLRVTTASNFAVDQSYMPRKPKEPFRIQIFPNEADPGHQKLTQWSFFVWAVSTSMSYPTAPLFWQGGSLSVNVWAHKGVVPFEPAHRDLWNGTTVKQLWSKSLLVTASGTSYPAATAFWFPAASVFVPAGTLEIRGKLESEGNGSFKGMPRDGRWGLLYKPANVPASEWQYRSKPVEVADNGEFTIRPDVGESDMFYQMASFWRLYPTFTNPIPTISQSAAMATYAGAAYDLRLTASAHRDPTWVDTPN